MKQFNFNIIIIITLLVLINLACGPNFIAQVGPTATPTKTPKPPATATSEPTAPLLATATAIPPTFTPMLVTDTPMPPTDTPTVEPSATVEVAEEATPTETFTPEPEPTEVEVAAAPTDPPAPTDTPVPTDTPAPAVAYKIIHYKVLGEGENNGGIFNKGGQHMIFLTVLDAAGNGLDGAIVKDKNGSALEVVTGSKGPGKAEIDMQWDPYKLYVAADPSGATTSEVSNAMNTAFPHIPDIVGKLGSIDNEYSVCPTPEIRCSPPFYNVHFSYEITFQKVQ